MIIVRLSGGLGNQMFQYAFARALKENRGVEVSIDPYLFQTEQKGIVKRNFGLDVFNITLPLTKDEDFKRIGVPRLEDDKLYSKIKRKLAIFSGSFVEDKRGQFFDSQILKVKDNSYLAGNWVTPLYFENIRDILLKEFTLRSDWSANGEMQYEQIKNAKTSVCIHVRRGDHVDRYAHKLAVAEMDYYEKAQKLIEEKVGTDLTYFVFTDDMQYVKENFPNTEKFFFVEHDEIPDYERLILMSKCTHNIISISSFAFWGAWLNQNPEKIVIAPEKLRNDGQDAKDYIPESLGWFRV